MDAYLTKPVSRAGLLDMVAAVVSGTGPDTAGVPVLDAVGDRS
jgi:hypothetical protein